jgi:hypothetical protein
VTNAVLSVSDTIRYCCNYATTATTPVNIARLAYELKHHPDQGFVNTLITGLRDGFDTGLSDVPQTNFECKNLRSVRGHELFVAAELESELKNGFMIGPYDQPPFDCFRINPIGVVESKYTKKRRLIMDLSAPHNNGDHVSINSLIDKDQFSLSYVRVDDAIKAIKKAGVGAMLCKFDIASAFKQVPVAARLWPFYGVRWSNKYYFQVRLAFGSRSSPKLFDMLACAICYIAVNNYDVDVLLHLLDDFLTIDRPEVIAERTMAIMTHIFNLLRVPLAWHKTMGPVQVLEYLGVTLDSVLMQARLPLNKVSRIVQILDEVSSRKTCTKRKLLSLLGHLNFASRVVVPGRTFVSYLLSLAHSVPELHHHVTLNKDCRLDMQMWRQFLSTWNGISMFHDDAFIDSADLGLFTDSSGIGYGGIWQQRQWFQGRWPEHLRLVPGSDTSIALLELYPIVVAAILWGEQWCGKKITFICDNQATVAIVRKGRSKSSHIMTLMRRLILTAAKGNFTFTAKHIAGRLNLIADSLSRFQNHTFRRLAVHANPFPCPLPSETILG